MPLLFEGIEGLTPELQAAIEKANEGYQSPAEVAGLKSSRDTLLAEKKAATDAATAAQTAADEATHAATIAKGDAEAINKSWSDKFETQAAELKGIKESGNAATMDAAVNKLAGAMADGTNADLLKPFIEKRLRLDDGVVKVTDKAGALTISTVADLETEMRADPMFAGLVVASRASGGGAPGGDNSGGASGVKPNIDGTLSEKSAALATTIPGMADLPVR